MVMLSVIMLNVIVLSVMAPLMELDYHQWPMLWTIYGRNQNDKLILKVGKTANIFMVVIGRKLFITLTSLRGDICPSTMQRTLLCFGCISQTQGLC